MLQLTPGELFPIVRQLNDPADTGTYYVQAVIRRSVDETLLATVNLTDQGGQRFKTNWQVVSDNGLGVFITITTIVYTDSGYTTKSNSYAIENEDYLIQERLSRSTSFGGGGVNYDSIRKIVNEAVGKVDIPKIEQAKMPKVDLSPVLSRLVDLEDLIEESKSNVESPNIDSQLEAISKAIGALPKPEKAKEVDLSPVLDAIQAVQTAVEDMNGKSSDTEDRIKKVVSAAIEEIKKIGEDTLKTREYKLNNIQLVLDGSKKDGPAPEPFKLPRKSQYE